MQQGGGRGEGQAAAFEKRMHGGGDSWRTSMTLLAMLSTSASTSPSSICSLSTGCSQPATDATREMSLDAAPEASSLNSLTRSRAARGTAAGNLPSRSAGWVRQGRGEVGWSGCECRVSDGRGAGMAHRSAGRQAAPPLWLSWAQQAASSLQLLCLWPCVLQAAAAEPNWPRKEREGGGQRCQLQALAAATCTT